MCVELTLSNVAPSIRCYPDGRRELLEAVEVIWNGCRIVIPMGYTCDASSVPRIAWRVVGAPTTGANLLSGIVHDRLYSEKVLDRKSCDKLFYLVLILLGKPKWQAKIMYYAVRVFGARFY